VKEPQILILTRIISLLQMFFSLGNLMVVRLSRKVHQQQKILRLMAWFSNRNQHFQQKVRYLYRKTEVLQIMEALGMTKMAQMQVWKS